LTCSGWFTHVSDHLSAAGQAQDMESLPAKDRPSTTFLHNQPCQQDSGFQPFSCWGPPTRVLTRLRTIEAREIKQ